jgi:hypothetical protein
MVAILLVVAFALLQFAVIMRAEQHTYGKPKRLHEGTLGSREELIASAKQFPGPKSKQKENLEDEKSNAVSQAEKATSVRNLAGCRAFA